MHTTHTFAHIHSQHTHTHNTDYLRNKTGWVIYESHDPAWLFRDTDRIKEESSIISLS